MLLLALTQFLLAAMVIGFAATVLTRAADRIADLTRFGRLLIGSILLAGATSLPELSVDVSAALKGLDDIAAGDLLGSSLFNLFILAVADLLHRQRGWLLSRRAAAHGLSATTSILLTAIVGGSILGPSHLSIGTFSAGALLALAVYALCARIIMFDQRATQTGETNATAHEQTEEEGSPRASARPLRRELARFAAATLAILASAPFLAGAAGDIADLSGLSGSFIGTTLVAFTTSLPELVATIAAVRIGSYDLALGNIFGSNAFNMAMFALVDLASEGPLFAQVSQAHALTAFWVIIITAVAIIGQLYHVERRRRGLEPDAVMMILLVVIALITLYQSAP